MTTNAGGATAESNRFAAASRLTLVEPVDVNGTRGVRAAVQGRLTHVHPAVAVLAVALTGYLAICLGFVALGLLITHGLAFLVHADNSAVHWFAGHRTNALNRGAGDGTNVADTFGILAGALIVAVVLFALRYPWDVLFLAVALVLELATFLTVNALVDRPRPTGPRLGSLPSTSSFPSGHTAAMVVLYGGVALLVSARCRARFVTLLSWLVAAAAAVTVGLARVYSAMHHPSDVVAGALLGLAVLAVAVAAVRAGERARAEHDRARTPIASETPVPS